MEGMHVAEAREHIEMVDRIVSRTSRSLRIGGEFFVVWGVFSALVMVMAQLALDGRVPVASLWALPVLLLASIVFSVVRGRQLGKGSCGISLVEREFFVVLWITLGLAAFVDAAVFRIFAAWASSAIWSVAAAAVLFFIASHGNRRALAGGIVLLVSLVAANFMPAFTGYVLALGMVVGYAGFGLVSLIAQD